MLRPQHHLLVLRHAADVDLEVAHRFHHLVLAVLDVQRQQEALGALEVARLSVSWISR
jgi:hypothetical protein